MGSAVIRTVVDPATGETIRIMGIERDGKLVFQRLASIEERLSTPAAYENLARFGEAASRAYGQKMKDGEPATWRYVRENRNLPPLTTKDRLEAAAKQRRYRELLGAAVPEMRREMVLHQALESPQLHRLADDADVRKRLRREVLDLTPDTPFL
jgi:hypothetical protein